MAGLKQVFEFLSALKNVPWGNIASGELQKLIDDPRRLAIEFPKFVKEFGKGDLVKETVTESLFRLLSTDKTIMIAACDGSRYIAKEKGVFKAFIGGLFGSWGLDKRGKSTATTNVSVHEMIKDATFAQMFGSLGSDLDKLCLSQHQIVEFCEKQAKWLRADGYATFFLFREGDQFYVARVRVAARGGLYVRVSHHGDAFVYSIARIVIVS
jgi:hypothetical protein